MTAAAVERVPGVPDGFDSFAFAWPFKPYRWVPDVPTSALARLTRARIEATVRSRDAVVWSARCGSTLVGIATLQPLEWDSRVLGLSAARLELIVGGSGASNAVPDRLLQASVAEAKQRGVRHMSARVDAADHRSAQALESRGFVNVDALMTFEAAPRDVPSRAARAGITLRAASPADAGLAGELAAAAFHHGRFHADPRLPPAAANAVYRTWAAACCEGMAADTVIVAEAEGRIAGFVACRRVPEAAVHLDRPTATIPLIATATAARGQGIGGALVAAAAEWCRTRDVASLDVGTQLSNVEAARLYQRSGFRLVAGSLSFSLFIDS